MEEPIGAALPFAATVTKAGTELEDEVVALFDRSRARLLHYLHTFRALSEQDAEEIVQEAFLALFLHLRQGGSRSNLTGWLYRVVQNLALKRVARYRRDATAAWAAAAESDGLDPEPSAEEALLTGETRARLAAVLRALPEQDRRCLALRADGLRYRDIGGVLGMSLGAVAKSLERSLCRFARAAKH